MSQIFFHEPEKYQVLGNKHANHNSKFHQKKQNEKNNLSSQDYLLNILLH